MAVVQFSKPQGDFLKTLHSKVNKHFEAKSVKKSGNIKLYSKTVIIIAIYVALYVGMLFMGAPYWLACICAMALGLSMALVGFNIMHDALHDAYSSKKSINHFFGLSMNALGADAHAWRQKHNLVHHTYTNVDGVDDDISKSPLMRMAPSQPRYKAHRFQHIYLTFLYAVSTLYWMLWKESEDYFFGNRFNVVTEKMKLKHHFIFWSSKLIYYFLYIALPIYVWGFGWGVLLFVLMHVTLGVVMSFVFQLAHVVENVEFEHTHGEHTVIDSEWAVHQIKTTSDFAVNSKVVSWLAGGLNYQVEHHLFPRISHVHYPALQKIVMETCKEFGVKYNYYPTTLKALASHFRHMRRLGNAD